MKGRDWYDMEWYTKKGVPLNLNHFALRALDSGDWMKETITENEFRDLLSARIDTVDMDRVKGPGSGLAWVMEQFSMKTMMCTLD